METENNTLKDKGLSIRSEEVNEVMGTIPHWIMRWGIALIGFIILIFGIGAYTFTIPEYIDVSFVIKGYAEPIAQFAPSNGTLLNLAKETSFANIHQTIAQIRTQDGERIVMANTAGRFYHNLQYKNSSMVSAGDTLGWIIPPIKTNPIILLQIPVAKGLKIRVGQQVLLIQTDKKDYVVGRIQTVAGVSTGSMLLAEVVLTNKPSQFDNLYIQGSGKAKVIIGEIRLIDKIAF